MNIYMLHLLGEENEEEEEEEEEGSSNYEEEGIEFYEDLGESDVFGMIPSTDRDRSSYVMVRRYTTNIDSQGNVNASATVTPRSSLPWSTTFPLPLGLFEAPSSISESSGEHKIAIIE